MEKGGEPINCFYLSFALRTNNNMGIKDLWNILTPYCERKPLHVLEGQKVSHLSPNHAKHREIYFTFPGGNRSFGMDL